MADFKPFAQAVRKRFAEMAAEGALFCVASEREDIWLRYLNAFPEGSNPIYRTRQEHDCSCCRHFIYNIGRVVAIQNGALSSIWDLNGLPEPYQTVADAMSAHIKGLPIRDTFLTRFATHGQLMSRAYIDNAVVQFDHFSASIPSEFVHADVATRQGHDRTTFAVLTRGLTELKEEALSIVLELIEQNNLYRGAEFKRQIVEFATIQARFAAIQDERDRDIFAWSALARKGPSVTRLRNTAIGKLLQDLSADVGLEEAVRKYEALVAPQNYRRSTSLITPLMIETAMATIQELGLEPALERRHARYSDVPITSVLFVDNAVRTQLKGGLESLLLAEAAPSKFNWNGAQEVPVDTFMSSILPKTQTVQLYLDNKLLPNFMSLTAPAHEDAQLLFKWGNPFAWSYDGNVTDTIRDKVKRAGGRVEGVAMRVSLAWFKTDDFDLHCTPPAGMEIYFGNKQGILDVDMNVRSDDASREPVENMRWIKPPEDGVYRFWVNNFNHRESVNAGFVIEIEGDGLSGIQTLHYKKDIPHRGDVHVADILINDGQIREIKPNLDLMAGPAQREHWGLKTLDTVRVNSIILSPNYWPDGHHGVGNKHWFFILDGCRNPLPVRGIYNEFLRSDLEKHRKVFEVLGDKTKCPVADEQMPGVGFSSTLRAKATVLANNRPYTICF